MEIKRSVEKKVKIEVKNAKHQTVAYVPPFPFLWHPAQIQIRIFFMWNGSIVNVDVQTKNYTWLCFEIPIKNLSNHSLLGKREWFGLIQLSRPEGNVISSVDWVPGTVASGGKVMPGVTWFLYHKSRHRSPSVLLEFLLSFAKITCSRHT